MFIPPKEKEELKNQKVDNIIVEGVIRQDNAIQNVDKINILKSPKIKPENVIELNDNLFIPPKEKEPLQSQIIDKLLIEGSLKPNNEIQTLDKLEIQKSPKPQNLIEPRDKISLAPLEKEPLNIEQKDELMIENEERPENIYQSLDKIEILQNQKPKPENKIEQNDTIFIPPKEKTPLNKQNTDTLLIEGNLKPNNQIQTLEKLEILKNEKPKIEYVIECNDNIVILPKEKEPLLQQNLDKLFIERIIKPENSIQNLDKFDILKSSKPKKENIIEENANIFIQPIEKGPLNKQEVDNILIEGNEHPENNIQNTEKFELLNKPKKVPENIINQIDSIYLPQKDLDLNEQKVDTLVIEPLEKAGNEIQKMDKINILKSSKPKILPTIEQQDTLFIPKKEKLPLNNQIIDNIKIEGNTKPDNEIQIMDHIYVPKTSKTKPQNIIEEKESIFISPKEKEELKNQKVDNIKVEGINREDNSIQNVFEINILKSPKIKQEYVIELNDNIFIKPKEKQPLIFQVMDRLNILSNDEDNYKKILEKCNERNDMESNCIFYIPSKEREPLQFQLLDNIFIEGNEKVDYEIQKIDNIVVDGIEFERPLQENINVMEQRENIIISPKEKEPLKKQLIDSIVVEKVNYPDYEIETSSIEILKEPKIIKDISENVNKIKEPLSINKFDVYVEGLIKEEKIVDGSEPIAQDKDAQFKLRVKNIPKKIENSIQKLDDINIIPDTILKILPKVQKPNNEIQNNENFEIISLKGPKEQIKEKNIINVIKEPLVQDKMDDFNFEGMTKPENEIEQKDKFLLFGNKKEKAKEIPINNLIQHTYSLEIPKINKQPNQITSLDKINILPTKKMEKEKFLMKENINEIKIENELSIPTNLNNLEIKPLEQDKIDDFPIEGEKRPDNAIESTKRLKILKNDKPPNQIINLEGLSILSQGKEEVQIKEKVEYQNEIQKAGELNIASKQKEPLLINNSESFYIEADNKEDKNLILSKRFDNLIGKKENDINIEGIKSLHNAKYGNENEIKDQEKIFIPAKKKEILLDITNENIYIEGNKPNQSLIFFKKFEILNEEKPNDIYLQGNKIEKIVSEEKKKEPLIVDNVINNLFIEGNKQNIIPKEISQEKLPLSEENTQNLFISGIQKEINKINIEKQEPKYEIQSLEPISILYNKHDLSDNLQTEFIHDICIGYKIKPENDNNINIKDNYLALKGKKKFEDISGESRDKFSIEGEKSQSQILPDIQNNNIIENNVNFNLKGLNDEDIIKSHKLLLIKIIREKNPYQICPKQENLYLEGNEQPEINQELYILRNRHKKILEQIKPNKENDIFIKGNPKQTGEITQKTKQSIILPTYQSNCQFSIYGKQKKPYIIENKGCFNINSTTGTSKKNYLIVQGSCFSLFGNKNEPGQLTQDIEISRKNINWNNINKIQRFRFNIDNYNKPNWNNLVNQLSVKFNILKEKHPSPYKIINVCQFSINKDKQKDEIIENDYNYISLEKDDKQRRTVKATISKVLRESVEEDNDDELDPFSGCKKHTGKKFDKIFKERKTNSILSINDEEKKPGTVIIKGDKEKKNKIMMFDDNNIKKGGTVIINNEYDRKTGPVVFKNMNDMKNNESNLYQYKNIGKSKSMGVFKSKEKKTEYLRDYDNEPRYFN